MKQRSIIINIEERKNFDLKGPSTCSTDSIQTTKLYYQFTTTKNALWDRNYKQR